MPSRIAVGPSVEPLTLAEAKTHLRVAITDDDALITSLIVAARMDAESITRRAFISQQWRAVGDRFPSPMAGKLMEMWQGQSNSLAGLGGVSQLFQTDKTGRGIVLPLSPLIQVDSIKYIDTAGVQQTLSPAQYQVDAYSEPPRILPAYGLQWPSTRQQPNAVEVLFTVGYGTTAAAVPDGIKAWMKLRIGSLYEHREDALLIERGQLVQLPFVDSLLLPYRVNAFL
jgi:uncharacterized phiE125 gp8 family phage protein